MQYFYTLVLLIKLICIIKGELTLEIVKYIKGAEETVSDNIREFAGTRLTLICNLVVPYNETSMFFDNELSWGWRHKNVQFNNAADLEHIAKYNPKLLYQFLEKSDTNQAVKNFNPLYPLDSGTYFCMSLKYKLFKVVKLDVTLGSKPEELLPYFKAMDESRPDSEFDPKGPLILPKFLCTNDKFTCKSGAPCFGYEYVCDSVVDCKDGSDEDPFLCGVDPCADKRMCGNGRCISESLCCNRHSDPDCTVDFKPACCSEHFDFHFHHGIPLLHPDDMDYSNDFTDNVNWSTYENDGPKFKSMWIAIPCILILIAVIVCIVIRQYLAKAFNGRRPIRSPQHSSDSTDIHQVLHSDTMLPTFDSVYAENHNVAVVGNQNLDKPPSYEEATSIATPSAPPCEKCTV